MAKSQIRASASQKQYAGRHKGRAIHPNKIQDVDCVNMTCHVRNVGDRILTSK